MITKVPIRSFATAAAISVAMLLGASCASQSETVSSVTYVHPKDSPDSEAPTHPLPPIRPAEIAVAPATQPAEEFTLTGTTRPAEVAAPPVAPPPAPPQPEPHVAPHRPLLNEPATQPDTDRVQPGPDNTGVADQKNLKISQKIVAVDNQVIENLFITGGIIANDTHNVVIRNCMIDAAGARYGLQCQRAENLTLEHCELYNMSSACVFGDGFTAKWNNCYQSGGDGFKPEQNCVVESNWVHDLGFKSPTAHSDGVQTRGGNNVKIIGNYFDMDTNKADTKSNSSCFIQGVRGKQGSTNITIEGNWCKGGNFTMHIFSDGGDATTIRVVNNRFMKGSARYGVGQIEKGVVWEGNVFDETNVAAMPRDK